MKSATSTLTAVVCVLTLVLLSCKKSTNNNVPNPPPPPPPGSTLTITSFFPSSGTYNTYVTIIGKGFSADRSLDTVKINGKTAEVSGATTDTLIIRVPLDCGTGPVTVKVNSQTATGSIFNYEKQPVVSTIAGNGILDFSNGASTISPINNPVGVAVDDQGNIYVAEYNRLKKITPQGTISVLAGSGDRGFTDTTIGIFARFNPVGEIVVDANYNVFMAEFDNQRIRKIAPSSAVSTVAGASEYGYVDGPVSTARFWTPVSVALDQQGNFYVADRSNSRIRKITPAGIVSTLAGNGKFGFKDGPGDQAEFYNIASVAVDQQGNVYVADETNQRIRKITPAGMVSTLAGSGANSYANGTGTKADFANPVGVAVDKQGNVYVADNSNHLIRKITPEGKTTTLAGTPVEKGYVDGPAATAKFYYPEAVAVDAQGNVYVADRANSRIRKITVQ